MKAWAAACAALLAAGCAGAPPREAVVVVEGAAPLGPGGAAQARPLALADARARALERGGSVRVAALSIVADGVSALQKIRSTARGTLRGERVLGESVRDGMLVLRLRARVREDKSGERPSLYVEGPPGARAALLRGWGQAGGRIAATPEEAELRARAVVEAVALHEPRLAPYRSWRARVRVDDATRPDAGWAVEREAPGLGLDDESARAAAVTAAAAGAAEELAARAPR